MELEAENWRLCSTTLVRGVGEYVGRWKMRTGEVVVQLLVRGVSGELEDFRFPALLRTGPTPRLHPWGHTFLFGWRTCSDCPPFCRGCRQDVGILEDSSC